MNGPLVQQRDDKREFASEPAGQAKSFNAGKNGFSTLRCIP
jgi:hypothetical protein